MSAKKMGSAVVACSKGHRYAVIRMEEQAPPDACAVCTMLELRVVFTRLRQLAKHMPPECRAETAGAIDSIELTMNAIFTHVGSLTS